MTNRKTAREREAILKRLHALREEIAALQEEIRAAEARLPLAEQLRLALQRPVAGQFTS